MSVFCAFLPLLKSCKLVFILLERGNIQMQNTKYKPQLLDKILKIWLVTILASIMKSLYAKFQPYSFKAEGGVWDVRQTNGLHFSPSNFDLEFFTVTQFETMRVLTESFLTYDSMRTAENLEMGPDPTQTYFWPAVNKGLIQVFFDPKWWDFFIQR